MKRFFGMMPSDEIEITRYFKDEHGLTITIDAGKHGWTIRYADHSSQYEDCDGTAQENFDKAYKVLCSEFNTLTEISNNGGVVSV